MDTGIPSCSHELENNMDLPNASVHAMFNNWANPILYILTNESFKQYVTSINPFKFCCAKEVPNGPKKTGPYTACNNT